MFPSLPEPAKTVHYTAEQSEGHIPSLDGLRAVSVIIVFFSHAGYGHLFPGLFGVTIFFFISGFLITTLLCREYARLGRIDIGSFFVRRFLRIVPPLVITVALGVGLFKAGLIGGYLDGATITSQLAFFANYHEIFGQHLSLAGLDVLWSLAVEEHFYLLWPFLFPLVFLSDRKLLLGVVIVFGFLIWRSVQFYIFNAPEMAIAHASDTRFDSLLIGCMSAFLFARAAERGVTVKGGVIWAISAACILILLTTFVIRDPAFRSIYRYSVQSVALIPIFFFAVQFPQHPLYRILNNRAVAWVGVLSYSIYLVHAMALNAFSRGLGAGKDSAAVILSAIAFSLVFALLVHHVVDRPLLALRKRYR